MTIIWYDRIFIDDKEEIYLCSKVLRCNLYSIEKIKEYEGKSFKLYIEDYKDYIEIYNFEDKFY